MFKEIRSHFKAGAKRLLHLLVVNVRRKPLLTTPYVFKNRQSCVYEGINRNGVCFMEPEPNCCFQLVPGHVLASDGYVSGLRIAHSINGLNVGVAFWHARLAETSKDEA